MIIENDFKRGFHIIIIDMYSKKLVLKSYTCDKIKLHAQIFISNENTMTDLVGKSFR